MTIDGNDSPDKPVKEPLSFEEENVEEESEVATTDEDETGVSPEASEVEVFGDPSKGAEEGVLEEESVPLSAPPESEDVFESATEEENTFQDDFGDDGELDDIQDLEEVDDLDDFEDIMEADDDFSDTFEEEFDMPSSKRSRRGVSRKKMVPLLLLVAAIGVGGYIAMNPALLSGVTGKSAVSQRNTSAPVRAEANEDISAQQTDMSFSEVEAPPQPEVISNAASNVPRSPEEEPVESSMDFFAGDDGQLDNGAFGEEDDLVDMEEISISHPVETQEFQEEIVSSGSGVESRSPPQEVLQSPPQQENAAAVEVASANNIPENTVVEEPNGSSGSESINSVEMAETINATGIMPETEPVEQVRSAQISNEGVATNPQPAPLGQPVPENNQATASPDPDVYFDSGSTGGRISSQESLPRKVDPVTQPGSKFVIVNKTHDADDVESLLVSADRAMKLQRYEAAVEIYDSLYDLNPRDQRILMGRAVAYQNAGRPESALKAYEELLAIAPDNTNALVNMLGIIRTQYPEIALRRLKILHEKYPDKASIVAQLGIIHADLGQNDEAVKSLGMAASMEPRNAQHLFNMAIVLDRAGNSGEALKYYEQALEIDTVYNGAKTLPREQIYDRLSVLRRR